MFLGKGFLLIIALAAFLALPLGCDNGDVEIPTGRPTPTKETSTPIVRAASTETNAETPQSTANSQQLTPAATSIPQRLPSTASPLVPTPSSEPALSATKQIAWTVNPDEGPVVLMNVPMDWEENSEINAYYSARSDVDGFSIGVSVSEYALPSLSVFRVARMEDADIAARVEGFLTLSDERKDVRVSEGEIDGVASVIMNSIEISTENRNEKMVRVYAHLEDDRTWMITCRAAEFDTEGHGFCDDVVASVRIAPESFVRTLTTPTPTTTEVDAKAEIAAKYALAGERLYRERTSEVAWADGSNWTDGVSHELPELPIPLSAGVVEGMTCAQWEALNMALFPEGKDYDLSNWWQHPDSDEIGEVWKENLGRTIYGTEHFPVIQLLGANFADNCGTRMR